MDIAKFLANFQGGGARANRYRVYIPEYDKVQFLCKATALPESMMGVVEADYMGRKVKMAGDKTFSDWNITVYNDTSFDLRNKFEQWHNAILGNFSNKATANNPVTYMKDATVVHLDRTGEEIAKYTFKGIFPSSIGEISLGYGENDSLEEFQVTFAVNWWEHIGVTDSSGGAGSLPTA